MNREPIILELTPQEIEDITICLNLPVIKKFWDKNRASRIENLATFFNELTELDNEENEV